MSKFTPNTLLINRYLLEKKIGVGGFAEVWQAKDIFAGEMEVAIKILLPYGGGEALIQQFIKEYRAIFAFHHPKLLKATHLDRDGECLFIVMPLCKEGSLEDALRKKIIFDEKEVVSLLFQMTDALVYLHGKGLLHNDMKPGNILIEKKGEYMLSDFGISTQVRTTLHTYSRLNDSKNNPQDGISAMSISYAAPELFSEMPTHSSATDVFALGVTIYEILTGSLPWMGNGGMMLRNGAAVPHLPPQYPKVLDELIRKCMSLKPIDRPTIKELRDSAKFFLENGYWKSAKSQVALPLSLRLKEFTSKSKYYLLTTFGVLGLKLQTFGKKIKAYILSLPKKATIGLGVAVSLVLLTWGLSIAGAFTKDEVIVATIDTNTIPQQNIVDTFQKERQDSSKDITKEDTTTTPKTKISPQDSLIRVRREKMKADEKRRKDSLRNIFNIVPSPSPIVSPPPPIPDNRGDKKPEPAPEPKPEPAPKPEITPITAVQDLAYLDKRLRDDYDKVQAIHEHVFDKKTKEVACIKRHGKKEEYFKHYNIITNTYNLLHNTTKKTTVEAYRTKVDEDVSKLTESIRYFHEFYDKFKQCK